jgi:predicted RNA-binding Zn-ribbon protein involved in translation (DUF1610 family)
MSNQNKSRKKRSILWSVSKEQLELIVSDSSSYSEILRKLNIFSQGSNINTLKRRIEYEKINTSHIKKGLDSNKGKKFGPNKNKIPNDLLFVRDSGTSRSVVRTRLIRENIISYSCSECGLEPKWKGNPLSMVLDHINGIPNDNRIENLRFLCPNCNSQMDTFAGRNTNRTKKSKIKVPRKRKFEISKEELEALLTNNSFVSVGKMFGVSDTAIRKRCKLLKIL